MKNIRNEKQADYKHCSLLGQSCAPMVRKWIRCYLMVNVVRAKMTDHNIQVSGVKWYSSKKWKVLRVLPSAINYLK